MTLKSSQLRLCMYSLVMIKIVTFKTVIARESTINYTEDYKSSRNSTMKLRENRFAEFFRNSFSDTKLNLDKMKYMAIIFKNDVYFVCAGTLISPYHVLTGAHCVINEHNVRIQPNQLSVRFGHGSVGLDQNATKVGMWFAHPLYKHNSAQYDAAVLEVTKKIVFSDTLAPVKLATDTYKDFFNQLVINKAECAIIGWESDLTRQRNLIFDKYFIDKSRVNLELWIYCQTGPKLKVSTTICTKPMEASTKCKGNSGGPLICSEGVQFGIATWNPGCDLHSKKQDIFTRVDSVYQFILLATDRQGEFWINDLEQTDKDQVDGDELQIKLAKQKELGADTASKLQLSTFPVLWLVLHKLIFAF